MQPTQAFTVTLDIAAIIGALVWPLALLAVLFAYRKALPELLKNAAGRVRKLGVGVFSLELAEAKSFVPEWANSSGGPDLRHAAGAIQINDSTSRTFIDQLQVQGGADYAVANVGAGEEWLTSRLYIMAILFARMKDLQAFVFLETTPTVRKRFTGWAEPEKIRWALAQSYPWLERAYAEAYAQVINANIPNPDTVVVSHAGRMGKTYAPNDASPGIALLQAFLERIQASPLPPPPVPPAPPGSERWILIDDANQTYERADWINAGQLEDLLGDDLHTDAVRQPELLRMSPGDQLKAIRSAPGRYVAVTAEDGRFHSLIDRLAVLEQAAPPAAAS